MTSFQYIVIEKTVFLETVHFDLKNTEFCRFFIQIDRERLENPSRSLKTTRDQTDTGMNIVYLSVALYGLISVCAHPLVMFGNMSK